MRASVNGYGVGSDDIADAFAALWTAARILSGCARPFPRDRTVDDNGTPMQMWAEQAAERAAEVDRRKARRLIRRSLGRIKPIFERDDQLD